MRTNSLKCRFVGVLVASVVLPSFSVGLWGQSVAPASPKDPSSASPTVPIIPPDALLTTDQMKDLLDSLDLSLPGLAAVQAAANKGDLAAAQHELAQYFRNRTNVPWSFDPHHPDRTTPFNKQVADDAVNGRVCGGLIPVWANFPNGKIDWLYNETFHQPGVARNGGWQGQLCRMNFWIDMAAAYRATGDEKYAKAWVQQMRSFVSQCPPPAETPDPYEPSAWHPIDTGIRNIQTWPDSFFSYLLSPSVSDGDLMVAVYGFLQNARYLSTHHGPGNGLLMEREGAYVNGCVFPEFKQSAQWRSEAVQGEIDQTKALFMPDGVEDEISTTYHNGAIDNITGLLKDARRVGRSNELPPDYLGPMEKAYDFELYMMAPDRQLPLFNDSSRMHLLGVMKGAYELFPNRKDFQWVATAGKEGQPPAKTSMAFDWAGLYAMRSSWDLNANFVLFFDGPFVFTHGHRQKLSVVMWAYGREILFNSGGGPYDASKWRQYSVDTFSKNTVLVDGLPQREPKVPPTVNVPKIDSRWESTPDYDFAAGTYNDAYGDKGLHPAVHARRVLFLKPDLAIVADTLTPSDGNPHTYQARWNLLTTSTSLNNTTHEVVTTDAGKSNLAIIPLNPDGLDVRTASGQQEPELLGWEVTHSTVSQPAAATSVLQTRQGTGVQTFLTLLVPMQPGTTDPVKSVESSGSGMAKVTFKDGRTMAIAAGVDPASAIEVTETLANGSPGRHVRAGHP